MRYALKLHRDSLCEAVERIEVEVRRIGLDLLVLRYLVAGAIDRLSLAPVTAATRSDGLWQHSCFEAFVRGASEAYYELNFAPSTQWAMYRFSGYRSGMSDVLAISPPLIEAQSHAGAYAMQVSLDLRAFTEVADQSRGQLGLSAILEETNGRKSYWALAHPPGKADFHHPDSFVLPLPPAA